MRLMSFLSDSYSYRILYLFFNCELLFNEIILFFFKNNNTLLCFFWNGREYVKIVFNIKYRRFKFYLKRLLNYSKYFVSWIIHQLKYIFFRVSYYFIYLIFLIILLIWEIVVCFLVGIISIFRFSMFPFFFQFNRNKWNKIITAEKKFNKNGKKLY